MQVAMAIATDMHHTIVNSAGEILFQNNYLLILIFEMPLLDIY